MNRSKIKYPIILAILLSLVVGSTINHVTAAKIEEPLPNQKNNAENSNTLEEESANENSNSNNDEENELPPPPDPPENVGEDDSEENTSSEESHSESSSENNSQSSEGSSRTETSSSSGADTDQSSIVGNSSSSGSNLSEDSNDETPTKNESNIGFVTSHDNSKRPIIAQTIATSQMSNKEIVMKLFILADQYSYSLDIIAKAMVNMDTMPIYSTNPIIILSQILIVLSNNNQ
ncbi:hypothetical protein ACF3NG_09775 [Aerococcaceae bacterium WGS1372]